MKKGILLLLLISSLFADAQSLKEALYGGKLKNQPGTVIRKGDDLAKLQAEKLEAEKRTADSVQRADSIAKAAARLVADSTGALLAASDSTTVSVDSATQTDLAAAPAETAEAPAATEAPKDNDALLKTFMDGIIGTLKSEVLSSKKVKSGSYMVLVSYAIETDGQLNITDVFVSPESDFLQEQLKQRLAMDTPKLNPVLSSSGKARKVNKKYKFTLVKE